MVHFKGVKAIGNSNLKKYSQEKHENPQIGLFPLHAYFPHNSNALLKTKSLNFSRFETKKINHRLIAFQSVRRNRVFLAENHQLFLGQKLDETFVKLIFD